MKTLGKIQHNVKVALRQILISVSSICLALLISVALIALMDIDPFFAISSLFEGSLGKVNSLMETLVKMIPLIFTGMSYALANRCGLINLGMEGQLYVGALCSSVVGIYFQWLPGVTHLIVAIVAGFAGGALWGGIAGYLKVKTGANEIITTVMLNSIATRIIEYMVTGPMIEPPGTNSVSAAVAETAKLPRILSGRMHLGLIIAIVFIYLFWLFLWKSKKGYEMRVSGQNMKAAVYSGIAIKKNMVLAMLLSGGVAGLAGASEILGIQFRLIAKLSPGYGFDGIAVALIGMNSPVGIVLGAFIFAVLRAGGNMMQMVAKVPVSIISVIQALVIISVVSGSILYDIWVDHRLKAKILETESKEGLLCH